MIQTSFLSLSLTYPPSLCLSLFSCFHLVCMKRLPGVHLVLCCSGGGRKAVFLCATAKAAAGRLFCFCGSRRPPPASIKGFRGRVRCIVPSRLREKALLTRAESFSLFSILTGAPVFSHSAGSPCGGNTFPTSLTDVFRDTSTDAASFFCLFFALSCCFFPQ